MKPGDRVRCDECKGSGKRPSGFQCWTCGGRGTVIALTRLLGNIKPEPPEFDTDEPKWERVK